MTAIFPFRVATDATVAMLQGNLGGVPVFTRPPTKTTPERFVRLHDMGGPAPAGPPLAGEGVDVCQRFQVDCVGRRHDQAQGLGDLVRSRMVASDGAGGWVYPVAVAGWRCTSRETGQSFGVGVEGQPGRELFVCRRDYRFDWTPA